MGSNSTLDRESFQQLLANAFAMQESQTLRQSLPAIETVQQLIANGELLDGAMHLIADCARNVANAAGAAIGLLQGDQLVYQAGSGTAATYTGRPRLVTLFVSTRIPARREVLRVENSETDARIEGEVCRQFGAKALIMLLIYRGHEVAGVLEVLFNEPHAFQDHEVDTYRSMAELVENALFREPQPIQKQAELTPPPLPVPPHVDQPMKRIPFSNLRWSVAAAGGALALLLATWIAYDHRSASRAPGSTPQTSSDAQQQPTVVPATPLPVNLRSTPQTAEVGQNTNAASSAFKRVSVGPNEVDYIAEDVTIRHFTTPKRIPPQLQTWNKQVVIGEDVTVRYFAYKPAAASPTRAVPPAKPTR